MRLLLFINTYVQYIQTNYILRYFLIKKFLLQIKRFLYDFSTPLPPLPPAEQYCNTVGYNHFNAQEDDIYSKPSVSVNICTVYVIFGDLIEKQAYLKNKST